MDLLTEYLEIMRPTPKKQAVNWDEKFRVLVDFPVLFNEVESLRSEFDEEDNYFIKRGTEDEKTSKEEYLADIDQMWHDLTELKENPMILQDLIAQVPKKKDGSFCIGRVILYKQYKSTSTGYDEEEYGWHYMALRLKTTSSTDAVVYINREIEHY